VKKRTGFSPLELSLNIALSIVIWQFLFGSIAFALVLVGSILIHEYGHYFWMGKESIKKRDMFMVPPFGAMAISKEPWPTLGAEARIALAGPAFGLLAPCLFYLLLLLTGNLMWAAGVALAAFINLFNLLPIAILDGGRVTRSLLQSINQKLEITFTAISLAGIAVFIFFTPLFGLFIGFLWFREIKLLRMARLNLEKAEERLASLYGDNTFSPGAFAVEIALWESVKKEAELFIKKKPMSGRELGINFAFFLLIVSAHAGFLSLMSLYIDFPLPIIKVSDLLKYF
jgi:Zn-dependent protease